MTGLETVPPVNAPCFLSLQAGFNTTDGVGSVVSRVVRTTTDVIEEGGTGWLAVQFAEPPSQVASKLSPVFQGLPIHD